MIMDVEKAYDRTDPRIALKILRNSGISGRIIDLIEDSTVNNKIKITFNKKIIMSWELLKPERVKNFVLVTSQANNKR